MSIKWGIIGTGNIAKTFANEFKYVDSGSVFAVASRDQERASEFAEKFGIRKAYHGYKNLVKDPEIDVVYIATPHSYHHNNTILCLKHNKAVLCEKPIAVNLQQTQTMISMAKEKNLFFMEAMWTYFLPAIIKAKKWISQGKIGEIKLLKSDFGFKTEVNPESRLYNPELAGGALLDVGIYPIAIANLLLSGQPSAIHAVAFMGKTNIDEHDSILLKYESGAIAQLGCSLQADLVDDTFIFGTEGKIHIPNFWKASKAILENNDGTFIYEDTRDSEGYNYEIEAVNRHLLQNETESDIMSFNESIHNIKIMDQIRSIIGLKYPFEK